MIITYYLILTIQWFSWTWIHLSWFTTNPRRRTSPLYSILLVSSVKSQAKVVRIVERIASIVCKEQLKDSARCYLTLDCIMACFDGCGISNSTISCFLEDKQTLVVVPKGAVAIFVDADIRWIEESNGDTVIRFPMWLIGRLATSIRHSTVGAANESIPSNTASLARV